MLRTACILSLLQTTYHPPTVYDTPTNTNYLHTTFAYIFVYHVCPLHSHVLYLHTPYDTFSIPTYTKTIHIDNQYTTYILIIDIYSYISYILTAYSASPPATHGFVLLGTSWNPMRAFGMRYRAYMSIIFHMSNVMLCHCHVAFHRFLASTFLVCSSVPSHCAMRGRGPRSQISAARRGRNRCEANLKMRRESCLICLRSERNPDFTPCKNVF